MAEERKPVSITVRCKYNGYAFDLQAELMVDHIPGLLHKLATAGIEAGNSPYLWDGQGKGSTASPQANTVDAPTCPVHGTPLRQSRKDPANWYCPKVVTEYADGGKDYCSEKVFDWHPN